MSRFTRRLLSREVDVLQTHRDQLARRAATRVLRAMAGVTRQRTLPTLAQTLRDYADKTNNSGRGASAPVGSWPPWSGCNGAGARGRCSTACGATTATAATEPDARAADGAGDPCAAAAARRGTRGGRWACGSPAPGSRRGRRRGDGPRLRRHSASRDFEPRSRPKYDERSSRRRVARGGDRPRRGRRRRRRAPARGGGGPRGGDDARLRRRRRAVRLPRRAVARQARDLPVGRTALQSLRRTRGEGDRAGAVEALGVHAALGAGRAVVEFGDRPATEPPRTPRAADVALAEATPHGRRAGARSARRRGAARAAARRRRGGAASRRPRRGAQPPADDDDRIGLRRRTATEAPGPRSRSRSRRAPARDGDRARPAFVESGRATRRPAGCRSV